MRTDKAKEEDFLVNNEKPEEKKYKYYLCDGSVVEGNSDITSSIKDVCAYSFYSSKTKKIKMFVLHSKGSIFDPNEITRRSIDWQFKSCNKIVFDLYTAYLNPKKRSRYRLIEAQKNL